MRKYIFFAVICWFFLSSVSYGKASNTLILLNAKNQQETEEAIRLIESVGGQVRHIFVPDVLVGFLPADVDTILLHRSFIAEIRHGEAQAKDYDFVSEANTKALKAWDALLNSVKTRETEPLVSSEGINDLIDLDRHIPIFDIDCDIPLGDLHLFPYAICWQWYCVLDIDKWEFKTSSYMIGRVAVGIILMESNGPAENWTTGQEEKTISEIVEGLDRLSSLASDEEVNLSWFYNIHYKVPTSCEPIQEQHVPRWELLPYPHCVFSWLNDALNYLGFQSFGYSGMYDYVNQIRRQYQTDWAYAVFVVMDENDPDHKFSDNYWAYTELQGPYVVMTYNNCDYGPDDMSTVIAHETCHDFGAADEYHGAATCNSQHCTIKYGYLQVENANCEDCPPPLAACLMRHNPTYCMCDWTKGQIGWRDSDADGPADPIDPNSGLHVFIYPVYPGDRVQIYTLDGDFVKLIPITPDNCAKFPAWSGYMTFWDGTNAWGTVVVPQVYLGVINDGDPFTLGLVHGDPDLPPIFSDFVYENDSLKWKLSQTYAWVRCKIYNEAQQLALYPIKDKLYLSTDHPYEYQTDVSALEREATYTGEFFGWRPDGGRSQIYEYSFYIPAPHFAPPVHYSVGHGPCSVFASDLDSDGDLDLVVANYLSHSVSILENSGDGTFQVMGEYYTANNPLSVSCADLDGDSDLDVVAVSWYMSVVSVLKNDGSGHFPIIDNYAVGSGPVSVFCADLDGDSHLDLAVANQQSGNVSILKNYGNGTFQDAVNYGAGDRPSSVFCADLDGDSDLDLAVANETLASTVCILENDGSGGFSIKGEYEAGDGCFSIFCADLDGDSDLDVAVANTYGDNVSVLENNGNGEFLTKTDYDAGCEPYSVFGADLDGDSALDLAVANHGDDDISILKNNGDGTFLPKISYSAGNSPWSGFCADFDGDGDLDLAVANYGSGNVSILKNRTQIPVNQPPYAFSLLSPADGDSVPGPVAFDWQTPYDPNFGDQIRYDLWVSTNSGFAPEFTTVHDSLGISKLTDTLDMGTYYWKVRAYDNWGAERWSTETWVFHCPESLDSIPFALPVHYSVSSFASCVFSADFDGDSALDLAVTNERWMGSVSILKNNGYGEFLSKEDFPTGAFPMSVFSADLDADGDKDLAVASGDDYDPTISILKNDGEGRFLERDDYDACSRPWSIFCADLDADSAVDLAVANYGSGNVSILKNNGDGTFQDRVNYETGGWPTSVFCADLDGDDDIDLAVAVDNGPWEDPAYISILKNYGDGTFQDPVNYVLGEDDMPHCLFCADLDGDSAVDIAVANASTCNVSILKNISNGTFQDPTVYDLIECPLAVYCADIDNDGDLDLVLDGGPDDIAVLKNNGNGSFHSEFHYVSGSSPWSLFCADLDGDTDVDIVTGNYNGYDVSVLKNLTQTPANQPPEPFSLISPTDWDSVSTPVTLDWQTPYDPDFDDQIRYDLYVSTVPSFHPDFTTIYDSLAISRFIDTLDAQIDYYWKVKAYDNWGAERWSTETWSFHTYIAGDCNSDSVVDLGDLLWLIAYIWRGGSPLCPYGAGDINCDCIIDLGDVLYLISYLYKGGPPPCGSKEVDLSNALSTFRKLPVSGEVQLLKSELSKDGTAEIKVISDCNIDVAAVQLELNYDPAQIRLFEPTLTSRTEGLQIYYSNENGQLKIGILDINGVHHIPAGEGPIMSLKADGEDFSSLTIEAIWADEHGNLFQANVTEKLETSPSLPARYSLHQNYPNPFNPETQISYDLPNDSWVKLSIYNIRGQKVKTLVDGFEAAGHKKVIWDGKNEQGDRVASGIYLYRLEAGEFTATRKMVLMR